MGVDALSHTQKSSTVSVKVKNACGDRECGVGYKIDGITYVPVRIVLENMGAEVVWNQDEQSVQIISKSRMIETNSEERTDKELYIALLDSIKHEVDMLMLLNKQLSNGIELYNISSETQWIKQISNGKLIERKNAVATLSGEIIDIQGNYESNAEESLRLIRHSKELNEIVAYYEFSLNSFLAFMESNKNEDYKNYLIYEKLALDIIENLIEDLNLYRYNLD